ncbi:hypothetical protein QFC22_004636 [Naganishia vaughanmartiniae]|uniref:Uncharacterized protein n=1 Tax=Naganishia vaughanmartiniae TaxID=1424756 RepID=A0ACC2WYZ0_9TREE|nr:hypothetical protein QFC22_004636 [Naganishia vaughanmartiniae]
MPTWLSLLLFCTYLPSIVTAFPTRYPGRTPACLEEVSSCDVPSSTIHTTIISATASPTQTIATTSSDLSATFSDKPSPFSTPAPSSTSAATPVIGKAAEASRIRSGNRLPQTYDDDQPQQDKIDHRHREGSNKNPPADAFASLNNDDTDNFSGHNETQPRLVRGDSFMGLFEEQTLSARGGVRGHGSRYRTSLVTSPKVRRIKEYVFRPHHRYAVDFGLSELPVGWTPSDDKIEADKQAELEAEKLAAMSKASSEAKDAETLLLQQQRFEEEENEGKRQADYVLLTERLQGEHNENENRRQEELHVALAMACDSSARSDLAKNAADEEREKYEHLVSLQQILLEQTRREYRRAATMVKPQWRSDKKPSKGPSPPPDDPPPTPERPSPPQQSPPPAADDVTPPSNDQKPLDDEHTLEAGAPETVVIVRTVRHDVVRYTCEVTTITNNVIFDWSAMAHTFSRSPLQAPPRAAFEEPESVLMSVQLIQAAPAAVGEQPEQPAPPTDLSAILSTAAQPEATLSGGAGAKNVDVNMTDVLDLVKKQTQAVSLKRATALADAQNTSPITVADHVPGPGDCMDVSSLVKDNETAQTPLECGAGPCNALVHDSAGTGERATPLLRLPAPTAAAEVPLEAHDANETDEMASFGETKSQRSDLAEEITWPSTLPLNVSAIPADVQPSWIDLSEFRDTLRGIRRFDAWSIQDGIVQTDSVSASLSKTFDDDSLSDNSESEIEAVSRPASVSGSIEVQTDPDEAAESLIAETPSIPKTLAPEASVEPVFTPATSVCSVDTQTDESSSMDSVAVQLDEAPSLCSVAVEPDEAPLVTLVAVETEDTPPMCSVTVRTDEMEADVSRNEGHVLNDEETALMDKAPAPQSSVVSVSASGSSTCSFDVQADEKNAAVASSDEHPCEFEEETTTTEVPALKSAVQSASTSSTATCSVAFQEDKVKVPLYGNQGKPIELDIVENDPTSTGSFPPANVQIAVSNDEATPNNNTHTDQLVCPDGIPQSTIAGLDGGDSRLSLGGYDAPATVDPKDHPLMLDAETTPKIHEPSDSADNLSTPDEKASPAVAAITKKAVQSARTSGATLRVPTMVTPASIDDSALKATTLPPASSLSGLGRATPFVFGSRSVLGQAGHPATGAHFTFTATAFGLASPAAFTLTTSRSTFGAGSACGRVSTSRSALQEGICDLFASAGTDVATLSRVGQVTNSTTRLQTSIAESLRSLESLRSQNSGAKTKVTEAVDDARDTAPVTQQGKVHAKGLVENSASTPSYMLVPATLTALAVLETLRSHKSSRGSNAGPKKSANKPNDAAHLPTPVALAKNVFVPALVDQLTSTPAQSTATLIVPTRSPAAVLAEPSRSLGTSRWSNPAPKTTNRNGADKAPRTIFVIRQRRKVNVPVMGVDPLRGFDYSIQIKRAHGGDHALRPAPRLRGNIVDVPELATQTSLATARFSSTSAVSPSPSDPVNADPTRSREISRWAVFKPNAERSIDSSRSTPVLGGGERTFQQRPANPHVLLLDLPRAGESVKAGDEDGTWGLGVSRGELQMTLL